MNSIAVSSFREAAAGVEDAPSRDDPVAASEERDLIERAANDPDAISQLYRRHYEAMASYIRRRVGCSHDAEDLISETFIAMVRNLPRYRLRGAPFRAWLYRLATTQVSRWARSKRRQANRELKERAGPSGKDASASVEAQREQVRLVLMSLPTRFQDVLSLHYLEGMSVVETASVLGCSQGTVKSRLSRGRARMREKLERLEVRHER